MTISYTLVPVPKWSLNDLVGRPLSGGQLFAFSNLNPTVPKAVYMDAGGANAWTHPIIFDENGEQGPFFWKFDTSDPNDSYYLRVLDANDNLQWDIFNYGPGVAGGGGGGSVTTAINTNNLITNNVFWRNVGSIGPSLSLNQTVSPGIHDGFSTVGSLPSVSTPDMSFIKDNITAIDTLSFSPFLPGSTDLFPDITPEFYLNYACTGAGVGETYKYLAIPVSLHLRSLANTSVTISLYARVNSGATDISLSWLQTFGEGGSPTAPIITPIQSYSLTGGFVKYTTTDVTPNDAGNTIGASGTDALYLLIQYPLSVTTNIDIAKPAIYLGVNIPAVDYINYDQVNSIISSPRTGDIRTSLNTFSPFGCVPMNDGTIGNKTNISSSNAITRANVDTYPLFSMIWNAFNSHQSFAQMYDNLGNKVVYGASSGADFNAFRQLALTKSLGRAMAGTAKGLPISRTFTAIVNPANTLTLSPDASGFLTGDPIVLSTTGTLPAGLSLNTTYYVISSYPFSNIIKLASSYDNSVSGTPISITTVGSGIHTITLTRYILGQPIGEEAHSQTAAEMASHNHPGSTLGGPLNKFQLVGQGNSTAALSDGGSSAPNLNIASQGSGAPSNIVQPTTYMNVFIKL